MVDENETTTTSTTEVPSTTDTTTAANNGVDANIQTNEGAPAVETATPSEVTPTDAKPAGSASPAVAGPANSPTLQDTTQTHEDRVATARSEAIANHAVDQGLNVADQTSTTEEVVA